MLKHRRSETLLERVDYEDSVSVRDAQYKKTLWSFLGTQILALVVIFAFFNLTSKNPQEELIRTERYARDSSVSNLHKGPRVTFERFLLNVSSGKGYRLVRLDLELLLDGKGVLEEVQGMEDQIFEFSLSILSSSSMDVLQNRKRSSLLQETIRTRLNQFLADGEIVQVNLKNLEVI